MFGKILKSKVAYALMLAPPVIGILVVYRFGVNAIYMDEWDIPWYLFENYRIRDLLALHNEHRVFFPRLLVIALAPLTKLNSVSVMYVTEAMLFVMLLMYLHAYWDLLGVKWAWLFLPVSLMVFSLNQLENMLNAFQVSFVMVVLFTVGSLFFIYLAGRKDRWYFLVLAAVCAVVASLSSAQGLIAWPAGLLLIFQTPLGKKLKRGWLVIWPAVAVVVWALYFTNYHNNPDHPPVTYAFSHPGVGLEYFFKTIGTSLFFVEYAYAAGIFVTALFLFAVYEARRQKKTSELSFFTAVAAASVLTAVSITLGRSGFGVDHLASRYTTMVIPIVICVYVMLLYLGRESKAALALVAALVLVVAASAYRSYTWGFEAGEEYRGKRQAVHDALRNYDLLSDNMLGMFYPEPARIKKYAPELKRLGWNAFSGPGVSPFSTLVPVDHNALWRIDSVNNISVAPFMEADKPVVLTGAKDINIAGWAVDDRAGGVAGDVYVYLDGRVFPATYGLDRDDVARYYHAPQIRYSGFRSTIPAKKLAGKLVHCLCVIVVTNDRKGYYKASNWIDLEVR